MIIGKYFHSVGDVRFKVFFYIERFYNRERRHSSCLNVSPMNYEKKMLA
ncbi:MAG: IS3 family transposase [Spirochaetes bacterium]|nr:IS3 family transposase [Spirochaetota bacterium]MBN2772400.1 IS3 family transposase [Spirochaetota bacterium]